MTSDHSPVFASFEVGVASQYVSKQGMTPPTQPTPQMSPLNSRSLMPLLFFRSQQCASWWNSDHELCGHLVDKIEDQVLHRIPFQFLGE